jgi:pyroglutamyl-peptidase
MAILEAMKKILLTAFEPFGGQSINASQQVARALQSERFEGAQLELLELPVERFKALDILFGAMKRSQPDIIIALGEARGRTAITPERVAINLDEYPIPDNAGNQPREDPIFKDGPTAYFSTLPIVAIKTALEQKSIPAAISNSAGTYLCNHLFYGVLHHLEKTGTQAKAGFIHIPLFPEQRPEGTQEWPTIPRETIIEGVKIAIQTCIAQ